MAPTYIRPYHVVYEEGGKIYPWDGTTVSHDYLYFNRSVNGKNIFLHGIPIHALYFNKDLDKDKTIRWDCINGFTDGYNELIKLGD